MSPPPTADNPTDYVWTLRRCVAWSASRSRSADPVLRRRVPATGIDADQSTTRTATAHLGRRATATHDERCASCHGASLVVRSAVSSRAIASSMAILTTVMATAGARANRREGGALKCHGGVDCTHRPGAEGGRGQGMVQALSRSHASDPPAMVATADMLRHMQRGMRVALTENASDALGCHPSPSFGLARGCELEVNHQVGVTLPKHCLVSASRADRPSVVAKLSHGVHAPCLWPALRFDH